MLDPNTFRGGLAMSWFDRAPKYEGDTENQKAERAMLPGIKDENDKRKKDTQDSWSWPLMQSAGYRLAGNGLSPKEEYELGKDYYKDKYDQFRSLAYKDWLRQKQLYDNFWNSQDLWYR